MLYKHQWTGSLGQDIIINSYTQKNAIVLLAVDEVAKSSHEKVI